MSASKAADIEKEKLKSYRAGIRIAADFADSYNSLSFHDFRVGDCIRAEFGLGIKKPRRNRKAKLLPAAMREVLRTKVGRTQLLQLAQAIDPEGWNMYVKQRGRVTGDAEQQLDRSIMTARRVLSAGYRDCLADRDEPPEMLLRYLNKRIRLIR